MSTFPWIRDSSTLSGTPPTNRLAITAPNGLYFSTSTNSSILAPSNSDLTIETAGTGDVIMKTNGNNRLTIDDSGTVTAAKNIAITDGSLTINNTTGGGTSDPLLVLNQALTGAILYEEVNNSRTASLANELYQISYKGKASSGAAVEYANVKVKPTSLTAGAASSKITFGVSQSQPNGALSIEQSFITSDANLYLQNKYISGVSDINMYTGNFVAPDSVTNMDGQFAPYILNFGNNYSTRILYKNIGLASLITYLPLGEQLTNGGGVFCSADFIGKKWIGTNQYIYSSNDNGASWNIFVEPGSNHPYQFNGAIKCMKVDSTNNFLVIGGEFTSANYTFGSLNSLNYTGYINTGEVLNEMQWGSTTSYGFNYYVYTIEEFNSCLYYGGSFTQDNAGYVYCNYFAIVKFEPSNPSGPGWYVYAIENTNYYGPDNVVFSIKKDTSTSNNILILGGNFTQFQWSSGPTSVNGGIIYFSVSDYSLTNNPNPTGIGDFINGSVSSMVQPGSSIYVVGSFQTINAYNYFVSLDWNGSGYSVSQNPYISTYTPSNPINFIGVNPTNNNLYWGESTSPYNLYGYGNLIGPLPSSPSQWASVIYLPGSTSGNGMCFCPQTPPLSTQSFWYEASSSFTLSSGAYIIVNNGQEYGPNATITFPTKGTSILLEWNSNNSRVSVISNNGCTGIGLTSGGGITTISAGSGISVTNPTGPTTTISNSGVLSLTAGSNISLSATTGNITISASGGGGGGDVYWSQLVSPSTTYSQLYSQISNLNVQFGLNASSTGHYDVAELRIDDTYINYTGNNNGKAGYLRVGYDDSNNGGPVNYTLLTNTTTDPCTMATINSDMHLFANKQSGVQKGQGVMYLYATEILPGNNPAIGGVATYLGTSSSPWVEVNSLAFNNPSDIKLKKDVLPMESEYCTELIKNIKPMRYVYKNDKKEKTHFGVIAQDIESIIGGENLALHSKENDTQTVCYTELIAPLIKTVQHLLKKVESLENEIKILKQ